MASHPHLFEDQTDEDFFDKLVDDEFGIGESSYGVEGMRRGLSSLSLGDVGAQAADSASVEVEGRDVVSSCGGGAPEVDALSKEDGSSLVVQSDLHACGEGAQSAGNFPGAVEVVESQEMSIEKEDPSKGTSVKVVEWSAFTSGAEQSDMGGFGSYSDFFPEQSAVSSHNSFALPEASVISAESHDSDVASYFVNSFGQQDGGHAFDEVGSQQAAYMGSAEQHDSDATDSLYWESMYPGWKYDYITNQWYQVDGQEATASAQVDGSSLVTSELKSQDTLHIVGQSQDTPHTDGHLPADAIVSERSEVSYSQQTAHPIAETITESSATGSIANWSGTSQGSIQYPPNMVFDPQYPEYYYDTNTSQWYTLASYFQTLQTVTGNDQAAVATAVGDGYDSTQSLNFYQNASNQNEIQAFKGESGAGAGSVWDSQTNTHSSHIAWQPMVSDQSTPEIYGNQFTGALHRSKGSLGDILQNHTMGRFPDQTSWQSGSTFQTSSLVDHDSTGSMESFSQNQMPRSFSMQDACHHGTSDLNQPLGSFSESQMIGSSLESSSSLGNYSEKRYGIEKNDSVMGQSFGSSNGPAAFLQGFTTAVPQQKVGQMSQAQEPIMPHSYYGDLNASRCSPQSYQSINHSFQSGNLTYSQFGSAHSEGRSSAGRPMHALVTFGFGGKLIVMKQSSVSLSLGSQDASGKTVSILNFAEVLNSENSRISPHGRGYFDSLFKHSFPGPLVGGNAATKDVNKWIDERISSYGSSSIDYRKEEHLRLILSLLKISFQHYGKLRSPFGTDPSVLETDGPESAVTKLFASVRDNGGHPRDFSYVPNCMHNLPSEGQIRTTALEVQRLLVSGKRQEALQFAQEGLLWGPALVLAAQLGEKFYVETVKKMAQSQFVSGSPLRTLCLLIAGQPADVFSVDNHANLSGGVHAPNQIVAKGMLDCWEENLAVITANRTKDDELVMVHLGDCLWKERDEIIAAHTCYLVAEATFESYSDSARLCLVGADHWKCPRTYASPDAIQRTELYEYSKVLGNSQFILLPFQPYKLIYAYILAEVGKVSDSLRYCQAISKTLKNSSRAPEAEVLKQLASSLEERLRTHQQGGYGSNLAPAKLVGKLFTSIDKSISRMMGSPPPSLPPLPQNTIQPNGSDNTLIAPKVSTSQSTMAISSLIPSSSEEKMNVWTGDNRRAMHNRSVSEPDFGRCPEQEGSGDPSSTDSHSKSSNAGRPSRFGRFGSQLFQKTIGWVARSRQANLGNSNKFYYDEKLKRWVEEGAELAVQETALPPPPTTSSFPNIGSDYNINNALSPSLSSNERLETKPSTSTEPNSAMPPMPPSTNQFSARGRLGVRSRYVDTFNKGGAVSATSFQAPSAPSLKSIPSTNFFVPAPISSSQSTEDVTEANAEASSNEDASSMVVKDSPYSSLSSSSSSYSMPRFPSVDNITPMASKGTGMGLQVNGPTTGPSRASSWSGSFSDVLNKKMPDSNPSFAMLPLPNKSSAPSGVPPLVNGNNLGDDLHEVEL